MWMSWKTLPESVYAVFLVAEHANVQPHSGSQANMGVYMAVLEPGDKVLGMDLSSGGHLTHGHPLNFSGTLYHFVSYGVNRETEMIDYDEVMEIAMREKPKLIVAGASAYPRIIDFAKFREIAGCMRCLSDGGYGAYCGFSSCRSASKSSSLL